MGRPEKPITWDGPVADLARRLRHLRDNAGRPTYQSLAQAGHYSATVLADAAAGKNCPTWDVAKAFAEACGAAAAAELHPLWARADAAARRGHAATRSRRALVRAAAGPEPRRPDVRVTAAGEPHPREAADAAQYVRQLRALRAWAGDPGHKEIGRRAGRSLPSSTLYDALSLTRTTLPPLDVAQAIAAACASRGAAAEWTNAWRAIRLREFDRDYPAALALRSAAPQADRPLRVVNDLLALLHRAAIRQSGARCRGSGETVAKREAVAERDAAGQGGSRLPKGPGPGGSSTSAFRDGGRADPDPHGRSRGVRQICR
jgi:hypothetical protein